MSPTQPDALGADLLRVVARLNRWATRHADFDVPHAQARLLGLIDEIGPARVSALADADNCSQPTMSAQVKRLEAQGWVGRTPDPDDARASLVSLSDAGARTLEGVRGARLSVISPILAELPADTLDGLGAGVAAMTLILGRVATDSPSRRPPREDPSH